MLLYLTIRTVFTRWKILKRRRYFVIAYGYCHENVLYKVSQELLQTTLNFVSNFFQLEFYHKNQVHGSDHAQSIIFHKSVINLTFHTCIWNLSLV